MKRPLFFFCLFIIAGIFIFTLAGVFDTDKNICLLPENKALVSLSCTVCKVDSAGYYVNKIVFADKVNTCSAGPFPKHFILFIPSDEIIPENSPPTVGNRLRIDAVFRRYMHATNPGEFDAYNHYSSLNIYGSLTSVCYEITDMSSMPLIRFLYQIRQCGSDSINSQLDEGHASVMNDMLFGDKAGLDPEIRELYQRNGISHILSISSLHISIIGAGLLALLKKLRCPPWLSAIITALVLIMFGIMTGMSISSMRAIGLFLIGVLASLTGRTQDRMTSIALVASILLILNPHQLTACGFLLSFLSVTGICFLYPAIEKLIPVLGTGDVRYTPDTPGNKLLKLLKQLLLKITQAFIAGISITLATLPVQLYFFYEVPTYSAIINLMIIPLMSILMISGYIAAFLPFLYLPAKLCSLILSFYEALSHLFEKLPFRSWNPGCPPIPLIILYYLFLLGVMLLLSIINFIRTGSSDYLQRLHALLTGISKHKIHGKIIRFLPLFLLILLLFLFNRPSLHPDSIIFMDVGQGDCILIYTDSRDVLLFDGGSSSRSNVGKNVIKNTLKYYGISHITAIYISHFDGDHINGIVELLESGSKWSIRTDSVFIPDYIDADTSEGYNQLIQAVNMQPCVSTISKLSSGDRLSYGSTQLLCIHPTKAYTAIDANESSMCLLVNFKNKKIRNGSEFENTSLLLCGDIVNTGEKRITDILSSLPPITLLKVSHHGSKYSTTSEFLAAATPHFAFISAGRNNNYGHPHPDTLTRLKSIGCKYYTTIESGAITVTIYGNYIKIRQFLQ